MKHFVYSSIIASVLFLCLSCTQKKNNNIVSIVVKNLPDTIHVEVVTFNIYNQHKTVLAETKTDFSGEATLVFPLEKATFANITMGEENHSLFLEPGYTLTWDKDRDYTIQYSGVGAEPNNYIAIAKQIRSQNENAGGKSLFSLDKDEFLLRNDSTKKLINGFHKQYTDSVSLPEHVNALLEKRNNIIFLQRIQNLGWNIAVEKDDFNLPEELDVINRIPKDTTLMMTALPEYALLLQMDMSIEFHNRLPKFDGEAGSNIEDAPLMEMKMIDKTDYPQFWKEFLHVKNMDFWMAMSSLSPQLDSAFLIFKRKYPHSTGLPVLEERYNRWLAIGSGKPAPVFSGFTPDGKEVSLNDLKGKVVYIDVWATWCGPCKVEIPYAKKLMKRFDNVDDVAFVYVSVDTNHEDWKEMVQDDAAWKGIHITDKEYASKESLWQLYMVWGIPRYILIDRHGDIVSPDALRPSSGDELADQIKGLLPADKQNLVAPDVL